MWVGPLGQEDPLEEEMVTHSSILAWEIPEKRLAVHGVAMSWTRLRDSATTLRAGGGVMGSYGDRILSLVTSHPCPSI